MVTEAQGQGDLIFPADAVVGDYFKAQNDITYELMPNLRWRNVIPRGASGLLTPPYGYVPTPDLVNGGNLFYTVPTEGTSEAGGAIEWFNNNGVPFTQNQQMPWYNGDLTALPEVNVAYNFTVQPFAIGQRFKWILDFDDPSLDDFAYIPPEWKDLDLTGKDTVYAPGQFLNAFNRPTQWTLALHLTDYLARMDKRDECSFKFLWTNGRQPGGLTNDSHIFNSTQYRDTQENFFYRVTGQMPLATTQDDFTQNGTIIPVRELESSIINIDDEAEVLYINFNVVPGQFISNLRMEITDPYAGTDVSNKLHSGLGMSKYGDRIYIGRPSTEDTPAVVQAELPTAFSLVNASTELINFQLDDINNDLGIISPIGLSVDRGTYRLLMGDTNGDIRQWGIRDLSVEDMGKWLPAENWNWQLFYESLTTTNPPLFMQYNLTGSKLAVLEDDMVMRIYDISNFDISTAVLSAETLDFSVEAPTAECFYFTEDGRSIVVPYTGAFKVYSMSNEMELSNGVWEDEGLLDIEDPRGLVMTSDLNYMFILEVPQETSKSVRVSQFEKGEE